MTDVPAQSSMMSPNSKKYKICSALLDKLLTDARNNGLEAKDIVSMSVSMLSSTLFLSGVPYRLAQEMVESEMAVSYRGLADRELAKGMKAPWEDDDESRARPDAG